MSLSSWWSALSPKKNKIFNYVTKEEEADFIVACLKYPPGHDLRPKMPGCNRITNSPCDWSETDPIEDKCSKCGTQFPGWS